MLTILGGPESKRSGFCDGISRRGFLRVGSLGIDGLSLPQILASRVEANDAPKYLHDRSVVLLFLSGGPSHIEFFDPKRTAPSEIHSITGEVKRKTPKRWPATTPREFSKRPTCSDTTTCAAPAICSAARCCSPAGFAKRAAGS